MLVVGSGFALQSASAQQQGVKRTEGGKARTVEGSVSVASRIQAVMCIAIEVRAEGRI